MITQLYQIYVNNHKRALFDGSLKSFKAALGNLDIPFENILQPIFGAGLLGTDVEKTFLSIKGCQAQGAASQEIDPLGVYIRIPEKSGAPDDPFVPPHFTEDEL